MSTLVATGEITITDTGDAVFHYPHVSHPVIVKNSPNAATSGAHTAITVRGKKAKGNVTSDYGWLTATANGATESATATDTASSAMSITPADNSGITSYTVNMYDGPTVATATLLSSTIIPVVFKGDHGAQVKIKSDGVEHFTSTDAVLDGGQSNITLTCQTVNVATPTSYAWTFAGFHPNTTPTNSGTSTQVITAANFGEAKSVAVTCTCNGDTTLRDTFIITRKENYTNGVVLRSGKSAVSSTDSGTSSGGLVLDGGYGAILMDSFSHKRLSWNSGNNEHLALRSGLYWDAAAGAYKSFRANDGGTVLRMKSDASDGQFDVEVYPTVTSANAVLSTSQLNVLSLDQYGLSTSKALSCRDLGLFLGNNISQYYNVADYDGASSTTGMLRVLLPKYRSNSFINIHIEGSDSVTGSWEVFIGGNNAAGGWANLSANLRGRAPFSKVRVGNNTAVDRDLIILGDVGDTWSNAKVSVRAVQVGGSNNTGWGTRSYWDMLIGNSTSAVFAASGSLIDVSLDKQPFLSSANTWSGVNSFYGTSGSALVDITNIGSGVGLSVDDILVSTYIDFQQTGLGAPTATSIPSVGSRLILWNTSGSLVDYAIGMDSSTFWNSIPSGSAYKWFVNTDAAMVYNGSALTLQNKGTNAIEIGRQDGVASNPYIDFHSNATLRDYDARIYCSGGSAGADGQASVTLYSYSLTLNNGTNSIVFTPTYVQIPCGALSLNNATANYIDFNSAGLGAPSASSRSAGEKIVLYDSAANGYADYCIGVEGNYTWFGVPLNTNGFKWYFGETEAMRLVYASNNAGIELGRTDNVASTNFIDFHTGTTGSNDYDTRIQATGGTASSGGGSLKLFAAETWCTGDLVSTTGVGYKTSTGVGGTATQGSSSGKQTTIPANTLNKPCGQITLDGASLASNTTVSFTFVNTSIGAGDVLVLNHVATGTIGAYALNAACSAGSAIIYVRNLHTTSLSEAIVIRYAVIKATIS